MEFDLNSNRLLALLLEAEVQNLLSVKSLVDGCMLKQVGILLMHSIKQAGQSFICTTYRHIDTQQNHHV